MKYRLSVLLPFAALLAACGGASPSPASSASIAPSTAQTSVSASPAQASVSASAAQASVVASPAASGATLNVGFLAPLTGPTAILGIASEHGAQMAVDEINQSGGINGSKLALVPVDTAASNATALNAAVKVLADKPIAILGSPVSTQNLAIAPTIQKAAVPVFFNSSADVVTTTGAPFFRIEARDGLNLPAAVGFIKDDLHKTKIGIVHSDDEYGSGTAKLAETAAQKLGLTVVANESFTADTRDFAPQLLKVKNSGAEVLMAFALPLQVAGVLKERVTLGLDLPLVGSNPIGQGSVLNLVAVSDANGAYGVGSLDPGTIPSPAITAWIAKFKAKYNVAPDAYAASYYDGVMVLKQAVINAKGATDLNAIKQGLLQVTNYQGISAPFHCTSDGECVHVTWIFQDKGKTPTVVKTVHEPGF